jgi:hypothetical protein
MISTARSATMVVGFYPTAGADGDREMVGWNPTLRSLPSPFRCGFRTAIYENRAPCGTVVFTVEGGHWSTEDNMTRTIALTTGLLAALTFAPVASAQNPSYSRYKLLDCRDGKIRVEMTRGELAYSPSPDTGVPYVSVYGGNQRVTHIIPCPDGGVITRFNGGGIYYSPNCYNLGGGGKTKRVYSGNQSIVDWDYYTYEGKLGILTQFSGGGNYFSPNCENIGGGGHTIRLN